MGTFHQMTMSAPQHRPDRSLLVLGGFCLAAVGSVITHLVWLSTRPESSECSQPAESKEPQPVVRSPPLTGRVRSCSRSNLLKSWPSYHSLDTALVPCRKTALLVVDCQPAYWDLNQDLRQNFPKLPANIAKLLSTARELLCPAQVVHIRANYSFKFAENFLRLNPDKSLPSDVNSCDWAKSETGEIVIAKPAMDAFHNTYLEQQLRSMGIEHVVVCGMLTSVCVLFTCQSAFAAGMRVSLYEDGCADRTVERHQGALSMYNKYIFTVNNDLGTVFSTDVNGDALNSSE